MPETRQQMIDRIAQNAAFDVIVVGGGINGIGVFHDLAHQGLRITPPEAPVCWCLE